MNIGFEKLFGQKYLNVVRIAVCIILATANVAAQDEAIADSINNCKIPGAAACIVFPDSVLYYTAGVTKVNGAIGINPQSKFHLGSNTKAITAFLIMKEVEENRLNLESKLIDLLPAMKGKIKASYGVMTLKDYLSHRAGVRPFTSGVEAAYIPEFSGTIAERRMKFTEYVLNLEPVPPNGNYTYSNAGYVVAAAILEKNTGKSWEQLVEETMDSLGIKYFIGFPNKENGSNPWGHWIEKDSLTALPSSHFYKLKDIFAPAGDIAMSVTDYSRWLQLNLNGLLGEDNYLKSVSYQKLHFLIDDYSLGWLNTTIDGYGKISTHDGSAGTYYCHAVIVPEKRCAIAVLANAADTNTVKSVYSIRDLLLKKAVK